MKIQYFYDLASPYSWFGYQILKQKLPIWKTFRTVNVEYIPMFASFVCSRTVGFQYTDTCNAQKNYRNKYIQELIDYYGLESGGHFERDDYRNIRSKASLLFLNVLRNDHPELQTMFMERFWREIYVEQRNVGLTNDILRVARTAGVQYSVIADIVLKIENKNNVMNFDEITSNLIDEKVIAAPWIKLSIDDINMNFSDVLRLELVDEIVRDPSVIPPQTDKLDRISNI